MKRHEKQAELDQIRDEVRKAYEADVDAGRLSLIEAMRRKRADELARGLRPKKPKPAEQPTLPHVDMSKRDKR